MAKKISTTPKIKGYSKGGGVPKDIPDFTKIKPSEYPDGYVNFSGAPGYILLPGKKDAQGNQIYYDPRKFPDTKPEYLTPLPQQNTASTPPTTPTGKGTETTTGTGTTPAQTTQQRNAQTHQAINEHLKTTKKLLDARNVPANIAQGITAAYADVNDKNLLLEQAFKKQFGDKAGKNTIERVKLNQSLSKHQAIKAIGQTAYNEYIDNQRLIGIYRQGTIQSYHAPTKTAGATDTNGGTGERIGGRMLGISKLTPEQADWNTKMDLKKLNSANALAYKKDPKAYMEKIKQTEIQRQNPKTVLLDDNNQPIPKMQYEKNPDGTYKLGPTGKKIPIIPATSSEVKGGMKKGGMKIPKGVKRKGYVNGNVVSPDLSKLTPEQLAQYNALATPADKQAMLDKLAGTDKGLSTDKTDAISAVAPVAAEAGSSAIDSINIDDSKKNAKGKEMFKSGSSTALKRAGEVTPAAVSLAGVTGGLSLLAIPAMAIEGAIEGAIKGKKKYNVYNDERSANAQTTAASSQYQLKTGGKVVGPGDGTSDSVKAQIEDGSFIVPKENAKKAEAIRKAYLNEKSGYAPIHQSGETLVNLSNGEHMFTNDERKFLLAKGVDLNSLAPDAKKGASGLQGGTPPEGKTATSVEKKPLDELPDLLKKYNKAETLEETQKLSAQIRSLTGHAPTDYNVDGTLKVSTTTYIPDADAPAIDPSTGKEYVKTPSTAEKVFAGLGGAAGLTALAQTAIGLGMTAGKKAPVDKVDSQLIKQQQEALDQSKTGFSLAERAVAENAIEMNRRANVYNITNLAGGDAGTAIAASRSANLGANQSVLSMVAQDAEIQRQKQNRADELTRSVASSRRQIFEDQQSMFAKNQAAGANLMLSGINNFFGNLRYQDYIKSADKRAKDSQVNLTF